MLIVIVQSKQSKFLGTFPMGGKFSPGTRSHISHCILREQLLMVKSANEIS